MPTKTQEYLRILAEGGDAPTDCCMTVTQSLIAEAIERINNLGGGGAVDSLADYVNPQTGAVDINKFTEAINAGKAFYVSAEATGMWGTLVGEGVYNATISNGVITLSSPVVILTDADGNGNNGFASVSINLDAATGVPTQNPFTGTVFTLPSSTTVQGQTFLSLGKLTINIGDDTYEYDGSQDVDIYITNANNVRY